MIYLWRVVPFIPLAVAFTTIAASLAATPSGEVTVDSGMDVPGYGDMSGTGWVTWTLTGQQARTLRTMIIWMFDESLVIPVGFHCTGEPTGATMWTVDNGIIDEEEATGFLECVKSVLTKDSEIFRFVRVTNAEPADGTASLSSQGLVGSAGNSTESLQIRLIFDVKGQSVNFAQTDVGMIRALHSVFDFSLSDNLQDDTVCPPSCRPFLLEDGWRVVDSPSSLYSWAPGRFLWHGSWSAAPWDINASVYQRGAYNNSYYTTDGLLDDLLDLRFATSANITFEHTGYAALDDDLEVKIRGPNDSSWTDLIARNDRDGNENLDNLPLDTLGTSIYDLTPWIGHEVDFRMRFADDSDGVQTGPGYYIRNIRIRAPSGQNGSVAFRHSDITVGFLSFYDFNIRSGEMALIRTPVGEMLFYDVSYSTIVSPKDATTVGFNILENPQLLFVALIFFLWFNPYLQRRVFESYRDRQPESKRGGMSRVAWIVWSNRFLLVLLITLYFFPTLLIGAGIIIGGAAFWALGLVITFGMAGVAREWYNRRGATMVSEPAEQPPATVPATIQVKPQVKVEKVKVEVQPVATTVMQGKNYLVFGEDSHMAYDWFNDIVKKGVAGLCMSTTFPEKVYAEYKVSRDVKILWLSDTSKESTSLNPKRLNFEIFRMINRFFSANPKAVFLLDGLENLVVENGFDTVDRFLKKISDLASLYNATLLIPLNPKSFSSEETSRIRKKFDRVETITI